jgi:hypothetical protein
MMKRPPAFQFYARDWLSNTMGMSMHHRGIYITVRAAMWNCEEPGTLPLPIELAARSAGIDPRSLRDFMAKFPKCFSQIDVEIAETSTRLRGEIAETSTRSHIEVSPMSVPMLVDLQLRAQWEEMQQRKQNLSDAGKRGNAKRWERSSGGDSGGDRSASASASASASSKTKDSQDQAVAEEVQGTTPAPSREMILAFRALGHEPFGEEKFRTIWLEGYTAAGENPNWTDIMEGVIQRCKSLHVKIPGLFYKHKHEIENGEVKMRYRATPL